MIREDVAPLPGGSALPISTVNCQDAIDLLLTLRTQDTLPPYDFVKVTASIKSLTDLFPHLSYYLDLISQNSGPTPVDSKAILRYFYPFYAVYNEAIHLLVVYHMTRFRRLLHIVNTSIDLSPSQEQALSPFEQEALKQIIDIRANFYTQESILSNPRVTPPTSAYVDVMVVSTDIGETLLPSGETVLLDYGSFHHLLRSDITEFLARGQVVVFSE